MASKSDINESEQRTALPPIVKSNPREKIEGYVIIPNNQAALCAFQISITFNAAYTNYFYYT